MSCTAPRVDDYVNIPAALEACPIFSSISQDMLQRFCDAAVIKSHPRGKVLFIHGDETEYCYLILSGWVKLFRETIEGTEAVIDVLTEGHIFGETSVFEDDTYGFSAEVVEQAQMIMLPTSLLKEAITSENAIAMNMLSSMSEHRRRQNQEIEHLNVQNAPQRIGCFLLRLCPTDMHHNIQLHLPYDKTLIAARLGMKPETFSRALAKLKGETKIRIEGPSVTIPEISRLVDYTCNHCSNSFPCEDLQA